MCLYRSSLSVCEVLGVPSDPVWGVVGPLYTCVCIRTTSKEGTIEASQNLSDKKEATVGPKSDTGG